MCSVRWWAWRESVCSCGGGGRGSLPGMRTVRVLLAGVVLAVSVVVAPAGAVGATFSNCMSQSLIKRSESGVATYGVQVKCLTTTDIYASYAVRVRCMNAQILTGPWRSAGSWSAVYCPRPVTVGEVWRV